MEVDLSISTERWWKLLVQSKQYLLKLLSHHDIHAEVISLKAFGIKYAVK